MVAIFEDFLLYPAWVSCQPLDQSRAQALELSIDSAPKNSLLSVFVVMICCQMNLLQIYKTKKPQKTTLRFSEIFGFWNGDRRLLICMFFSHPKLTFSQMLAPYPIQLVSGYLFLLIQIIRMRSTWSPSLLGDSGSSRLKHWKNQSSSQWLFLLMTLVLLSGSAPDGHDPRGDQ